MLMSSLSPLGEVISILLTIFIWLLPAALISRFGRTEENEKVAWVVGTLVFWPVWIAYLLLAPIKKKR